MKKLRLLITIILVACCLSVLSACETLPAMQTPTNLKVELTNLSLSWKQVKDARLYTVNIQNAAGEEKEFLVSKNNYSLSFLEPGEYTIRVKTKGKEDEIEDSAWSKAITFVREKEPGLVMTLSKDRKSYEVTEKGIATGDIVIPDTYRGKPVTAIAKKAFFNKSDVFSVTIGKNITTIGEYAFANCSYLTSVNLPEGLTSIGNNAFASCRSLTGTLVIPNTLTDIPEKAFAFCGQITDVQFGTGVKTIGSNAFAECGSLVSVTLPDNLYSVGDYAFSGCDKLADVDFGAGVQIIGPYAFSDLHFLRSIELPDSLTAIGEGAFYMCENLADVKLGSGLEMLQFGAFQETALWKNTTTNEVYVGQWFVGLKDPSASEVSLREDTIGIACEALAYNRTIMQIELPNSVQIIGNGAFAACEQLTSIVIGSGVVTIGDQAFAASNNLTNVFLGSYNEDGNRIADSSLKTIGNSVFQGCTSLKEIEIPSTVTSIGSYAFKESGLENMSELGVVYAGNWAVGYTDTLSGNVKIRENTVGLATYAFYASTELKGIELPNSVKYVGRGAFYNCRNLTSAILPNSLEVIEDYTFYHCDKLQLFALPPALRSIGRSAFYKCGSVLPGEGDVSPFVDTEDDGLVIPSAVTFIGDFAFYGCGTETRNDNMDVVTYGFDVIAIGDGVTYIGPSAFYGFVSLRELIIGDGLEEIGEKAFQKCTNLKSVVFGESLKVIGNKVFYKCENLETLELPDNIQTIGTYAFYGCESLRTVDMGHGVTEIGNFAFYACTNLKNVKFSTALQVIGKQAFRNCFSLASVALGNTIQQIQPHAFYGCNQLTMYMEAAQAGENWDRFWNSSYRPVIWECTLSEEKDYVVSFTKSPTSVENKNMSNAITVPTRAGYVCIGWNTNSSATEAVYTSETIVDVTDGRKLYAIWVEEAIE